MTKKVLRTVDIDRLEATSLASVMAAVGGLAVPCVVGTGPSTEIPCAGGTICSIGGSCCTGCTSCSGCSACSVCSGCSGCSGATAA